MLLLAHVLVVRRVLERAGFRLDVLALHVVDIGLPDVSMSRADLEPVVGLRVVLQRL